MQQQHATTTAIVVRVTWDGQGITGADIVPRVLAPVTHLLRGKTAAEAAPMVAALFGLCGQAQGAAAAAVLAAASGSSATPSPSSERRVLAEALLEHLWQLLLDIPVVCRQSPDPELLLRCRAHLSQPQAGDEHAWQQAIDAVEQALAPALLGQSADRWDAFAQSVCLLDALRQCATPTARTILACIEGGGSTMQRTPLMPPLPPEVAMPVLYAPLQADPQRFSAHPHWRGGAMETGALARQQSHPAVAALLRLHGPTAGLRMLARLLEIAELLARLRAGRPEAERWIQAAAPAARCGLAWAQTARGLLLHHARLDSLGRIADYCIVAPTEWNFAPDGPCRTALTGCRSDSEAEVRRHAALVIQSLDPCVPYRIELDHA